MRQLLKNIDVSLVLLVVAFALGIGAMIWHVSSLQSSLLRTSAINTARIFSDTLTEVRTLYTSDVVQAANAYGMEVTHDYWLKKNAIPLPATFSMRLGDLMGRSTEGAYSRLYSAYPFPWRLVSGGLNDEFAKQAWRELSLETGKPFIRFVESKQGLALRYATADVMRPACIDCHNLHPESPRNDWRVGDLRGVLEIFLPLEGISRQVAGQVSNIRLIYSLVGVFMMMGFALAICRLKFSENALIERTGELEVANQKLKDISEHDALTQIANRRSYDARLSSEISAAKRSETPISMLLIDIDDFKLYNDGYGHEQGDRALIRVANIANECMARDTDFLARYGGEEFVALLPYTEVEGAIGIAESIRANIEATAIPHDFTSLGNYVTVSIGIASLPTADLDAGELFKLADAALYRAKANGRNRCEVEIGD